MVTIVFDFDGVFIDSEILKTKSYYDCITASDGPYRVSRAWENYLPRHPVGAGRPEVCCWIVAEFNLHAATVRRAKQIESEARQGKFPADILALFRENLTEYEPKGTWVPWKAIAFDRGVLYERIKDEAPAIEPAKKFLARITRSGARAGLVSRTKRAPLMRHLERIGVDPAVFGVVVCEDDLPPERRTKARQYQEACVRLGVEPESAVAVEDTDKGVEAARSARMGSVVAVPTSSTRVHDFLGAGARIIVSDLTTLFDENLREICSAGGSVGRSSDK